jgi:hypothetical protein
MLNWQAQLYTFKVKNKMVSEPGNSREIWKPLKVPDEDRSNEAEIKEQQAKKTFFRTDHSPNSFTATYSTIPGIPDLLFLRIQKLFIKVCKAWCYTMPCYKQNQIL